MNNAINAKKAYEDMVEAARQEAHAYAMGRPLPDEETAACMLMAQFAKAGMPGDRELKTLVIHTAARALFNGARK